MRWLIVVLVAGILVAPLRAQDLDSQAQAIAARLRCPVCQNESVADSPAVLAAQMRSLIREKLAAGESPEQITAYFVSRYGEWILLEPPHRGVSGLVWVIPPLVLVAGGVLAARFLRRSLRPAPPLPTED